MNFCGLKATFQNTRRVSGSSWDNPTIATRTKHSFESLGEDPCLNSRIGTRTQNTLELVESMCLSSCCVVVFLGLVLVAQPMQRENGSCSPSKTRCTNDLTYCKVASSVLCSVYWNLHCAYRESTQKLHAQEKTRKRKQTAFF